MQTAVPIESRLELLSLNPINMLSGASISPNTQPLKKGNKVVLPTMDGLCFEKIKDIAYLEAQGNYTSLHFADKRQILVCKTLREVESLLPDTAFSRIHRSHTIHLRHIKKYVKGKGGYIVLQNGITLSVSTGQKDSFVQQIKQFFG